MAGLTAPRGAFLLAIAAGALFILMLGQNPLNVYAEMIRGCFRSKIAIQSTVKIGIPLLVTSLGVTLAFKMKFWNIGAEGQLIMGAVFATYFALFHSDWPHLLLMLACFLAGIIGGGLWGLIPAVFKARFNTNETLLTLMLNYIAYYIVDYLRQGPWQDPEARGFPKIATFDPNAYLGKIFGVQFDGSSVSCLWCLYSFTCAIPKAAMKSAWWAKARPRPGMPAST